MANLFNASEFAVSKAKPMPIILLLDTSDSMNIVVNPDEVVRTGRTGFADGREVEYVEGGKSRIDILNEATRKMLATFKKEETQASEFLVSIISFGGDSATLVNEPTSASQIVYSDLSAKDLTPLGSALAEAKSLVEDKEKTPSRAYRPLVVLVSDGDPNDSWEQVFDDFIENGRSAKCDRMALGIGEEARSGKCKEMLERFVAGTGHEVFEADQAEEIIKFFKYVTMSVVQRTLSNNPNVVPPDSTLEPPHQAAAQEPAQAPAPTPIPVPVPPAASNDEDEEEAYW
jgi:uncharacterized protein YegL